MICVLAAGVVDARADSFYDPAEFFDHEVVLEPHHTDSCGF
jgi:hypothetical protein